MFTRNSLSPLINTFRTSTTMSQCPDIASADYQEIKNVQSNTNVLLVDVREPGELQNTGVIPGSINVPLGTLKDALKNMSDEDFHKTFNMNKPEKDFPVIFSCQSGRRSCDAAKIALELGYKNVKNYAGGWLDWEKHLK